MKNKNEPRLAKPFSDVHLLQREYYNGAPNKKGIITDNKFRVFFTRMIEYDQYIILNKGMNFLGPPIAILEPGGHVYLPHGYFEIKAEGLPNGELFDLTMNLEKAMFKGNKTPSNQFGLDE